MNNKNLELLGKFLPVLMKPGFLNTPLTYALAKVLFYEYVPVVILFFLSIQLFIMTLILTYCHK
jgi:hypothetical protein